MLLAHARAGHDPTKAFEELARVDAIMRDRPIMESVSVASQWFQERDSEHWKHDIGTAVRNYVYEAAPWRSGRLAQTLAILIRTLRDLGRDVKVITSNYDLYVELELRDHLRPLGIEAITAMVVPEMRRRRLRLLSKSPGMPTETHEFLHVHGYVSSPYEPGRHESPISVLSECDYFANEKWAADVLKRAFEDRAMLIIGCAPWAPGCSTPGRPDQRK